MNCLHSQNTLVVVEYELLTLPEHLSTNGMWIAYTPRTP
jgi:hypothetical protein